MYYKLYKPSETKKCKCVDCAVYPELFHLDTYSIEPYRVLRTISEAKFQLKNFPDAIIIEIPNDMGDKQTSYKNINTGVTWMYNGHSWKPIKQLQ